MQGWNKPQQEDAQARYREWLACVAPTPQALEAQRQARFPAHAPRWSVICPVDTPQAAQQTLRSLQAQTYAAWELCVAGEEAAVHSVGKRERVRPAGVRKEENALRAALRQANGTHLLFLGPGDCLAPDALYLMSRRLVNPPEAEIVYADEDALLPSGARGAPLLKPDFAPETLLSLPYLGRMAGYAKTLFEACGGLAQWTPEALYELSLRATEKASGVAHIPRVLLTCAAPPAAPEPHAFKRAAQAALKRRGVGGYAAAGAYSGSLAIQYGLQGEPRVSVVVTDTIGFPGLRRLLESIEERSAYERYELIVVQDGRQDAQSARYYAALAKNKAAQVLECAGNASEMRDCGARQASGELLLFLDAGLELETPDALYHMAALARLPGVGAVGGKLVTPEGAIYSVGTTVGLYGWMGALYRGAPERTQDAQQLRFTDTLRNVSALDGACLMVERALYRSVGGFDRSFNAVGWDTEFCVRLLRHGRRIVYTPAARFVQHCPRPEAPPEGQDKMRCMDALRPMLATCDPYYGPHYDYSLPYPRLAIPPAAPLAEQ